MSEILKFKVFCIEMYKQKNNMSGSEVYDLFKKYKVYKHFTINNIILSSFIL